MKANQHFDEMEYFDETYIIYDDAAIQKRKFDEIWRVSLRYEDMMVTTCASGTCRVRGFIAPSARAVIEHDIEKILK